MMAEKKPKPKITRRKAGLVITPPPPRPVQADHPASFIFREAIEAQRAAAIKKQDQIEGEPAKTLDSPMTPQSQQPATLHHLLGNEAAPAPASISNLHDITEASSVIRDSSAEAKSSALNPRVRALPRVTEKPAASKPVKRVEIVRPSNNAQLSGNLTWEEFEHTFKKRLSKSQLKICHVLFEKTYAQGLETCLIRTRDLMEMSQVVGRTMYYALSALENAGFIVRGPVYNTPTKRGQVISFYPTPRVKRMEDDAARHFHYYDGTE
jgi:hypothetical protein